MGQLMKHEWAGNIRELENAILRGILFAAGDEIRSGDIDLPKASTRSAPDLDAGTTDTSYKDAKERVLSVFNHRYIGNLLELCNGNVTQAAEKCGMKRQALQQIIRRYQIKTGDYRK
jgi:DNA-binding NtrC family response regulator